MYIAKVYFRKKLLGVRLYENYEHFISDLTDGDSELYSDLPDDCKFCADRPRIKSVCVDDLKFNTDFEYEYEGGLVVYCGEVMTEEAARR